MGEGGASTEMKSKLEAVEQRYTELKDKVKGKGLNETSCCQKESPPEEDRASKLTPWWIRRGHSAREVSGVSDTVTAAQLEHISID